MMTKPFLEKFQKIRLLYLAQFITKHIIEAEVQISGKEDNHLNNNKEKTLCTDDNTSDRHPTNSINILLVFASCIWLVIIGVCIMQRDKITVDINTWGTQSIQGKELP